MTNLLVVDDELNIRILISDYATAHGYNVLLAENGAFAIDMCDQQEFDLIIMDIMMPVLDGFTAASRIREKYNTPIIMLSARGEEADRIQGFLSGVDDYITKPFSLKELMLRIEAILRRGKLQSDILNIGNLSIDRNARRVCINNVELHLTRKEYDLLLYMAERQNIAIPRERFIIDIWGYNYDGFDRTLDTHIKLLREKLKENSNYIKTLRGVGYRFNVK